jgi:hypothetical protein
MNQVFAQPVGRDPDLHRPSLVPVLAYAAAIVAGGAVTGLALGLAGSWGRSRPAGSVAVVAVACLGAAAGIYFEARGTVAPLPQRRRQVPQRWLSWQRASATAAAYGFVLGMGVWTLLHHAAAYVVAACLLLAGPLAALAAGVLYGLVRGAVLVASWAAIGHPAAHERFTHLRMPSVVAALPLVSTLSIAATAALALS